MWRIWRGMRSRAMFPNASVARQVAGSRPVILHHVQFRRPRTNARQVVFGSAVFFLCAAIYVDVVIDPWDRFIRAHLATLSREELLEMKKKMEEPSFWPVPFTIHEVPEPPYKGSDPEWKMFQKWNKDEKLNKKIRNELADRVQKSISSHPMLSPQQPWKIRHWWLQIDYPRFPPPVYHRKGIEITKEGYSWTAKEVDRTLAMRLQRTLWPEPMAMSMFTIATTLCKQNALNAAARFGYKPSEDKAFSSQGQSQTEGVKRLPDKAQQGSPNGTETVKREAGAMATAGQRTPGDPPAASASTTTTQPSGMSAGSGKGASARSSVNDKDARDITAIDLVPFHATRAHIDDSLNKGMATFRQKWRPYRMHPPKGSFLVSGLVEVESAKHRVIVDVQAWYDPKENQFDPWSMFMSVRKSQPKQQYPANG